MCWLFCESVAHFMKGANNFEGHCIQSIPKSGIKTRFVNITYCIFILLSAYCVYLCPLLYNCVSLNIFCSNVMPCCILNSSYCIMSRYFTAIRVILVQSLLPVTLLVSGCFPYINFSPSEVLLKPITHLGSTQPYSIF